MDSKGLLGSLHELAAPAAQNLEACFRLAIPNPVCQIAEQLTLEMDPRVFRAHLVGDIHPQRQLDPFDSFEDQRAQLAVKFVDLDQLVRAVTGLEFVCRGVPPFPVTGWTLSPRLPVAAEAVITETLQRTKQLTIVFDVKSTGFEDVQLALI